MVSYFKVPSRKELLAYFYYMALATPLFIGVYGLSNWLAKSQPEHYQLFFNWERQTPFVPEFILIYFSLNILTLVPIFVVGLKDIVRFGNSMCVSLLVAGLCFILFPSEMAFERPHVFADFGGVYSFLYSLDEPHNLVPSLHITFSLLAVMFLWQKPNPIARLFFAFWFMAICVSVLLVHQHHVIDILGGIILATLVYKWTLSKRFDNFNHWVLKKFF